MSMKRQPKQRQASLWISADEIASAPGHPFYRGLEGLLSEHDFDAFVEALCEPFYKEGGRPSVPPGVYFRMLLVGYFERINSERGICWRCADSRSLAEFLGLGPSESTPDRSSLSRIRSRLPLEIHEEVFSWVVKLLAGFDLIDGKTLGVDATTLEANAALRTIQRRDTGEPYQEYLEGLAKESGNENPTREDLAKLDKKRPKKGSNKEWVHPHDPDAEIMKMKSGGTHLAHKLEHAVDMSGEGAVLGVTLHGGATGDTKSMADTLAAADDILSDLSDDPETAELIHPDAGREVVADKGYHANDLLVALKESEYRSYIAEPDRGRRKWTNAEDAQHATYANRQRIRGDRGKKLTRQRSGEVERPFAHYLEAGGMRRTHLRSHSNIMKRLLVHIAGFNLSILLRHVLGAGTPRQLAGLRGAQRRIAAYFWRTITALMAGLWCRFRNVASRIGRSLANPANNDTTNGAAQPQSCSGRGFSPGC